MNWTMSKTMIQTGYVQTEKTAHGSDGGRFVIVPKGGTKYCSQTGAHGQKFNHFVWSGYRMTDTVTGRTYTAQTVKRLKRIAERIESRIVVIDEIEKALSA